MEYFFALIKNYFGSPEASSIAFVVLTTLAVFTVLFAVGLLILAARSPLKKRLSNLNDSDIIGNVDVRNLTKGDSSNPAYMDSIDKYLSPQNETERHEVGQKLLHAGFHNNSALQNYYAIKTLLTLILPALTLFILRFDATIPTSSAFIYTIMASALGMFGPNIVLERILTRRQRSLRHGFPDMLDLLVVCVESGMGLDAALQRVAGSVDMNHPALAYELSLVNASMQMGVSRTDALDKMVDRTGLKDIKGLVSVIDQSMRFGTSVADRLRIYSEEFRDKRMQEAEEKAAKIGAKLLFPMLMCIWPSFFIIAAGPGYLSFMDALSSVTTK